MHGPEAGRGEIPGQQQPRIAGDDPNVDQVALGHALGGAPGVLPRQLDSEKVVPGIGRRRVRQEQPLARADLELDGMVVAEDLGPRDRGSARGEVEDKRGGVDRRARLGHREWMGFLGHDPPAHVVAVDRAPRLLVSGTPMIRP